jgi:Recombinase
MRRTEWLREAVSKWPSSDEIRERAGSGWRLAAIEWEREVEETQAPPPAEGLAGEEIPFGTRIAGDCVHLEANPTEVEVLNLLAEMVVQDHSYKHMADVLNDRAFRTREGKPWTALSVFKLTPRLIEVAPRILSGAEWENRKKQLSRVAWNS